MNSDIRWGVPSDGHTFPIYAGPADDMDRIAEFADERGVQHIRFGGDTWRLTADEGPEAQAETPTGTWTAKGNSDKFHTSDRVTINADRHEIGIIAESRRNFVLDIDGEKAGQYSSDNRGLRNLHVEFEGPGEKLPLDVQVFVSWVARRTLETRVVRTTGMLTMALAICVVIAIVVWFTT
ncbi:hypothetical protein [Corynebacterium urealyticum]|uniref:Uncharacterized protein n=1 Tax=Corynebacterium urealyticum TaxID=43771 RepID=A0A5D4FWL6_9CORY|nr:hypothetical protein [Corynebacterium urealyticum]TYR20398.1 hypothetical protein FYJ87_05425 [Corynebacterium urealyticum]